MEPTLNPHQSIKFWAEDDRPREKLQSKGASALSNAELLAILINTGTKDQSALALARNLLNFTDNNLASLSKLNLNELKQIKGIGNAKAITIAAALELGRRRNFEEALELKTISSSRDAYAYFKPHVAYLNHEEFWILYLNRANKAIKHQQISVGGVAGTVVDVKLIFKHATQVLASSIILCHNHPSGNLKPSQADIEITKKLRDAGKILEILIADHLIITDNGYFSFADEGLM